MTSRRGAVLPAVYTDIFVEILKEMTLLLELCRTRTVTLLSDLFVIVLSGQ